MANILLSTLRDYWKAVSDAIVASGSDTATTGMQIAGSDGTKTRIIKTTASGDVSVDIAGKEVVEVLTEASAVANVLTFSDNISAIEIWHNETDRQDFIVNGITISIPSGITASGWRSIIGGVPSAQVTIPTGVECTIMRLI